MFLESSYQPKQEQVVSTLSILDVAILAAQIGDKPFLRKGSLEHLKAGQIQLVCYYAQGIHIATTGRSLFKNDFFIVDNRIENPQVTEIFGPYDRVVTPFSMDKSMEKLLANKDKGFTADNNLLVQDVIYKYAPCDYKETMKLLRETAPFKNAEKDEFKKISKVDIKDYFDHLILKKTEIFNPIIGE